MSLSPSIPSTTTSLVQAMNRLDRGSFWRGSIRYLSKAAWPTQEQTADLCFHALAMAYDLRSLREAILATVCTAAMERKGDSNLMLVVNNGLGAALAFITTEDRAYTERVLLDAHMDWLALVPRLGAGVSAKALAVQDLLQALVQEAQQSSESAMMQQAA